METLKKEYDKLQLLYGAKDLNSVYGYGCESNPDIAFVFMNPTKRNIATDKSWTGIRAQWLGTKQIWDFLTKCNLFDSLLNENIKKKKAKDWTKEFCEEVYNEVKRKKVWITNLAKCTQVDARPLPDTIFKQYKNLLEKEINIIKPKKIIFFGNQVSSIMLSQPISVSCCRKKEFSLKIENTAYPCYAVYYPVGNGIFNQAFSIEDIKDILKK